MKVYIENKYSMAWSALFQCVQRGQKERALGVFSLLSQSLQDDALVYHLRGDVYSACGDRECAIVQYESAVKLYQESKRDQEALALGNMIEMYKDENK